MSTGISIFKLFGSFLLLLNIFFMCPDNTALAKKNAAARPYIVVIDPGHGGEDTGAVASVGKTKIFEKNLTMGIAIRLGKVLSDRRYSAPLGRPIKVIFTREKDQEVSLEERSRIAHDAKADLFVSVHLNSNPSPQAGGVETYFLNNTDQKSSDKLAEIENITSKRHRSKIHEDLILKGVAVDATVEASSAAANFLHKSLLEEFEREQLHFKSRGVKQALLYVLLDAEVPAVLCEPLFMSNKSELQFLLNGENRQKIAEGFAIGILRFLATR